MVVYKNDGPAQEFYTPTQNIHQLSVLFFVHATTRPNGAAQTTGCHRATGRTLRPTAETITQSTSAAENQPAVVVYICGSRKFHRVRDQQVDRVAVVGGE